VLPDMPIDYGDLILCHLGAGETQVYNFTGSAGETITIEATHPGNIWLCGELWDPDGTRISILCEYTGRLRLDVPLTKSGIHRILMSSYLGSSQDYLLSLERVAPPSPSATPISYSQNIAEELNPGGDVDLYFFGGTQNDSVAIVVTHPGNIWLCAELWGPEGTRISILCEYTGTLRINARLTSTGAHTIRLSGYIPATPQTYTLNLQCLGGSCPYVPPTINVTLTGSTACQPGDTFAASATLSNPLPRTIEQKLGYVLPDGSTSSIGNPHQELPQGYSFDGEVDRRTISGGDQSGSWQLCGRLLEVNVGRVLGESCRVFTVTGGTAPQSK
jgi:hypothetical protein